MPARAGVRIWSFPCWVFADQAQEASCPVPDATAPPALSGAVPGAAPPPRHRRPRWRGQSSGPRTRGWPEEAARRSSGPRDRRRQPADGTDRHPGLRRRRCWSRPDRSLGKRRRVRPARAVSQSCPSSALTGRFRAGGQRSPGGIHAGGCGSANSLRSQSGANGSTVACASAGCTELWESAKERGRGRPLSSTSKPGTSCSGSRRKPGRSSCLSRTLKPGVLVRENGLTIRSLRGPALLFTGAKRSGLSG